MTTPDATALFGTAGGKTLCGWTIGQSLYPAEHTGALVVTEYGNDVAGAGTGDAIPTRKKAHIRAGVPPDVFGRRKASKRK